MLTSYHNDCFEILPTIKDSSIDLILTDPPYEISKDSGFSSGKCKKFSNGAYKTDFGKWDHENIDIDRLLKEFYRILKPMGYCIIFYDIWKIGLLKDIAEINKFVQPRIIQFQKTNPVPVNSKLNYLTNGIEYAITLTKKCTPTFNTKFHNGVYKYPICHGKERTEHPTQKPLALMKELIRNHSNEDDIILDCFMGSGTTGEACIDMNRSFIGIELDDVFFEIANKRLNDSLSRKRSSLSNFL